MAVSLDWIIQRHRSILLLGIRHSRIGGANALWRLQQKSYRLWPPHLSYLPLSVRTRIYTEFSLLINSHLDIAMRNGFSNTFKASSCWEHAHLTNTALILTALKVFLVNEAIASISDLKEQWPSVLFAQPSSTRLLHNLVHGSPWLHLL